MLSSSSRINWKYPIIYLGCINKYVFERYHLLRAI
jgi:hypothetical protein